METTTPRNLSRFQASLGNRDPGGTPVVAPVSPPKPKLLDQVRQAIRTRHYSPRTEETYVHWIKRFIFFHNKRHPLEVAEPEIARFLSNLATESHVSASTQNQALNAVLFLYRQVLRKDIGYVDGVVRANRPKRLPTVPVTTGSEVYFREPRWFGMDHGHVALWSGPSTACS